MHAAVLDVKHFRIYRLRGKFLLRTDHAALIDLLRQDFSPKTGVQIWNLQLSEYIFRSKYQLGSANTIADLLSRMRLV